MDSGYGRGNAPSANSFGGAPNAGMAPAIRTTLRRSLKTISHFEEKTGSGRCRGPETVTSTATGSPR